MSTARSGYLFAGLRRLRRCRRGNEGRGGGADPQACVNSLLTRSIQLQGRLQMSDSLERARILGISPGRARANAWLLVRWGAQRAFWLCALVCRSHRTIIRTHPAAAQTTMSNPINDQNRIFEIPFVVLGSKKTAKKRLTGRTGFANANVWGRLA